MTILIDNKSVSPIYEQVRRQLAAAIVSGELQEDAPLPSIRTLAKDLRISVVTTKRAYEELERAGLIYAVAAKGFFVAPLDAKLLREQTLRKIEAQLQEAVRLANAAGISREELSQLLDLIGEE